MDDERTARERARNLAGREIGILLPQEFVKRVDQEARRRGLSRSAVLRQHLMMTWEDDENVPVSA